MMHELRENRDGSLTVQTYDIVLKDNRTHRVMIHQIIYHNEDKVIEYLMSMGIKEKEAILALDEMEANGHNMASFGVRGGFVFSKYEGAAQ